MSPIKSRLSQVEKLADKMAERQHKDAMEKWYNDYLDAAEEGRDTSSFIYRLPPLPKKKIDITSNDKELQSMSKEELAAEIIGYLHDGLEQRRVKRKLRQY